MSQARSHGVRVRGSLVRRDDAPYLELGPAWCRSGTVSVGDTVAVRLEPEGPQLDDLGPELRAALDADPAARRAFESLATFYRKAIVREVDGVKRPETRRRNLAAAMDRLRAADPGDASGRLIPAPSSPTGSWVQSQPRPDQLDHPPAAWPLAVEQDAGRIDASGEPQRAHDRANQDRE